MAWQPCLKLWWHPLLRPAYRTSGSSSQRICVRKRNLPSESLHHLPELFHALQQRVPYPPLPILPGKSRSIPRSPIPQSELEISAGGLSHGNRLCQSGAETRGIYRIRHDEGPTQGKLARQCLYSV